MPASCKTRADPISKLSSAPSSRAFPSSRPTCGLERGSAASHARTHVVACLVSAGREAEDARASDLLRELREMHARTLQAIPRAEASENAQAVLLGVREVRRANRVRLAGAVEKGKLLGMRKPRRRSASPSP